MKMSSKNRKKPDDASQIKRHIAREERKRRMARKTSNFFNDVKLGLVTACILFAATAGSLTGLRAMGFESELVAAKHLAAGADCHVAKLVKLAPAKMEQPGYWMHLDKDKDGTACEE